ncbi:MAG TPA: hypothetical protein DCX01_09520, partial [Bacteroidetes bacterium]|nr:hypothetical protein [Bacteroidota bacterium]
YKKQWAQHRRKKKREVRFALTPEQFKEVEQFCKSHSDEQQSPTALARILLLEKVLEVQNIPNRKKLENIYRNIGLVINTVFQSGDKKLIAELESIEQQLQNYLKQAP